MATYQGPRGRIGSSNLEVSMTAMDVGQDEKGSARPAKVPSSPQPCRRVPAPELTAESWMCVAS
jgi:hypothetical protein